MGRKPLPSVGPSATRSSASQASPARPATMPAPSDILTTVRRASAIALSLLAATIYTRDEPSQVLDHPGCRQHFAGRNGDRASPVVLPGLWRGDIPADADCHARR